MSAAYFAIGAVFFAVGATQAVKIKNADPAVARKAKQGMFGFYIAGILFVLAGAIGMGRGSG